MSKKDRITIKGLSVSAMKEGDHPHLPRRTTVTTSREMASANGSITFPVQSGLNNDILVVITLDVCKSRPTHKPKGSKQP